MLNSYTKSSTLPMVFCFQVFFFFTNSLHQSLFITYDLLISVLLTHEGQAWCSGESCLTESPGRGFEAASPQILRGKGLPWFFPSPRPHSCGSLWRWVCPQAAMARLSSGSPNSTCLVSYLATIGI